MPSLQAFSCGGYTDHNPLFKNECDYRDKSSFYKVVCAPSLVTHGERELLPLFSLICVPYWMVPFRSYQSVHVPLLKKAVTVLADPIAPVLNTVMFGSALIIIKAEWNLLGEAGINL